MITFTTESGSEYQIDESTNPGRVRKTKGNGAFEWAELHELRTITPEQAAVGQVRLDDCAVVGRPVVGNRHAIVVTRLTEIVPGFEIPLPGILTTTACVNVAGGEAN